MKSGEKIPLAEHMARTHSFLTEALNKTKEMIPMLVSVSKIKGELRKKKLSQIIEETDYPAHTEQSF